MFFRNQKNEEGPKYEKKMVDIWQCTNCIGWMQKEYTISNTPSCPLCSSTMQEGMREINMLIQ